MSHLASINPTDLSGLDPVFAIGLLALALTGAAALVLLAWLVLDLDGDVGDYFGLESAPVDRGTALPYWFDEDSLQAVATQHDVDGIPSKVERRKRLGLSIPLFGGLRGKADGSTKVTEKPYDDRGKLILRVLGKLHEKGELNRAADCALVSSLEDSPIIAFSGTPDSTKAFFEEWLEKHFPEGLQAVLTEALATELAGMGSEISEERLREELGAAHHSLASSDGSILLLEGEWTARDEDKDGFLLERTDIKVAAYDEPVARSVPMPAGVAIHVRLDGELTRYGQNSMHGVTRPIRACVMGTVRQYDPDSGCLEIAPIAVFQRLGPG
jgi:hypothetical protein